MMGRQRGGQKQLFYSFNLNDHVPPDHLLHGIDQFLDLGGLHQHLAPFYSHTDRPSIGPQLLIRMLVDSVSKGGNLLLNVGPTARGEFDPRALAEYERCFTSGVIHASCEDYRASAGVDLEHDRADRDAGMLLTMPLLALWGEHGIIGRCFKPLDEWRRVAADVRGH